MRRPIVITMALLLLCGFCLAAGLGAGSYAGVDSPLLRLSHENMKAASGRISFWSGGNQLSFTVTAPEKGLYKLLLNAWGSLCENEGPIMRASVAGQSVGTWKLNDKPAICASPALKLEAGDHEVTISFLNDKSAGKEDRNLYLNGVACGAVKSETALPALLFGGRPLAAYGKPQEPQDGRKTEVKLSSGGGLQSGEFAGTASGLWRVSSENMRSKAGQLSFWGSSHLTLEVNAPQDGLYKFVIRAWGSPCQGVWPLMSLEVGEKNCLWTASGNPQLFITPAVELAAGRQQVKIAFANDGNAGKEDRNLFLNGFAFGQVSESGALPELLFDNKPLSSLGRPVEGKLKKLAAKNPWEHGVAPFYPAKKELADYSSPVAAQDQLSVKLDCGAGYRLSEFSTVQSLNGKWKISGLSAGKEPFAADEDLAAGYQKPDFNDASWDSIDVPLDWYRKYPAARTEAKPFVKGWYRKALEIPASLRGKRVFLRFDVIGYEALLFVNGRQVGSHHGDFTPWDVEITDFVSFGAANTVISTSPPTLMVPSGASATLKAAFGRTSVCAMKSPCIFSAYRFLPC